MSYVSSQPHGSRDVVYMISHIKSSPPYGEGPFTDMDEVYEYHDAELADYVPYADEEMYPAMEEKFAEALMEDEIGHRKPRAVHQCNECNKIFVSFKGLQQHAIIHTDQKPFTCDICHKAFRFKSNLFEHRSVHSGSTPHVCPYCGKTCRLKGNLKKHLKTHVQSKEELDEAWRPFASNRRPPSEIPHDAIIVRSTGEPSSLFMAPTKPRKRKLGLGPDARCWVEKIRKGELLPTNTISEKMRKLADFIKKVEEGEMTIEELFEQSRALPYERFDCPLCKSVFLSRMECSEHLDIEHPMARLQRPLFCEICLKSFADKKSMEQHESYHTRVQMLAEHGDLQMDVPDMMLPEELCDDEDDLIDNGENLMC